MQAAKLGKTLAETAKSSKVGTPIAQLAKRLSSIEEEGQARSTDEASLIDKLGIKSLLSKKPGKEKQAAAG